MGSAESRPLRRFFLLLVCAVTACALAACQVTREAPSAPSVGPAPTGNPPANLPPPAPPEAANPPILSGRTPVRVALLLPFSASDRDVRQIASSLLNSAELAVFEVGNPDLLLLPKDTGATASGAAAAAREALAQGAEIILGPLLREEVQAVAPLARQSHVPVLAFSTDRSVAGDGVYLLSFQPEQEVARVTSYAIGQGKRSFAALIPNTDYGTRVRDAFVGTVDAAGAEVVAIQPYDRSASLMSDPVKALADYENKFGGVASPPRADAAPPLPGANPPSDTDRLEQYQSFGTAPFDAVLLPEGGDLLRTLAPLLPYYDVDPHKVQFLGTGLWDDPILGREPALDGGWFAAPSPQAEAAFTARYQQAFSAPPARLASLSFDAVALTGALASKPKDERFTEAALTNPNGFTGIDGIFRFRPDGSTERGLAVLEVTPNGFQVISPAPTSFEPAPVN